jgi:hypothetical protein
MPRFSGFSARFKQVAEGDWSMGRQGPRGDGARLLLCAKSRSLIEAALPAHTPSALRKIFGHVLRRDTAQAMSQENVEIVRGIFGGFQAAIQRGDTGA